MFEVIKGTVINGKPRRIGDIVDVKPEEVKELMAMGRIIPASEPVVQENRSVGLEVSETPKPKKRGRPKANDRD